MNIRLEIRSDANGIAHSVWIVNTLTEREVKINSELNRSRGPNAGKSKQHMLAWAETVAKTIGSDCAVIS